MEQRGRSRWRRRVTVQGGSEWLRRRKLVAALFFGAMVLASMILAGCTTGKEELKKYDVQYLDYFDTLTSVTIYARSEDEFARYSGLVRERLEHYHQLFDIYHNYEGLSNIKTINDYAGVEPVVVEPEVIQLLQRSVEMYEQTDGMVNVAMGSVLSVWHDYRETGKANPDKASIPDETELVLAAEHADIRKMVLDTEKKTVYLEDPKMSLDVGAVAKGFAAQKICDGLRAAGAVSALVSIGGNVQAVGARGDGEPWRVGIQNPDLTSGQRYLYAMELKDVALVTSGDYQRYYVVDGERYHHIIRPGSWMPWKEYKSVTILCSDGMQADALSTAVFNMEFEEGQALVESLENTEAMWICSDGTERFSSGFGQYMEKR